MTTPMSGADWDFFRRREDGRPKWLRFRCQKTLDLTSCMVPIEPQSDGKGNSWRWNGSESKPTLSPSIHCTDCGYHFFVTDGHLDPAPAYNRSELAEFGEREAREAAAKMRKDTTP